MKLATARDTIDVLYGRPLARLSDCLRGFIVAEDGFWFIGADLNAIEARKVAWLAGDEPVLDIFRNKQDVYKFAASDIYTKPALEITDNERQVGKVAVLALGFGGGVGAFYTMSKAYNVNIGDAFPALWASATPENREKALANFKRNGRRYETTQNEFLAADLTKLAWREKHPKIVKYWYDLEEAACNAVGQKGKAFVAGAPGRQIKYLQHGSFLLCRLPSGRVISYPYPKLETVETPWGEPKIGLTYMATDVLEKGQKKRWGRTKAYGGLLCENVTQASSRCVLSDAIKRLESRGYPVVFHVHDEIICELLKGKGSVEEMSAIMSEVPAWAPGLPILAKGWNGCRYQK
jgi:DNA polymerase